jgi:hypothetical protein
MVPELLRRYARPFSESTKLGPYDSGMNLTITGEAREATIGSGDYVFAADDIGEPDNPFSDKLLVLDEVGSVSNDTRNQSLSLRNAHSLPNTPFVLVSYISCLERISAGANAKYKIHYVLKLYVMNTRANVDAVTGMVTYFLFGYAS